MRSALLLLLAGLGTGCTAGTPHPRACALDPEHRPLAPPPRQRLYDGRSGEPIAWNRALARLAAADIVLLGEVHGHPAGARFEIAVLEHLARRGSVPLLLAMEFLERDMQPAVDAFANEGFDVADLARRAKAGPDLLRTHGPLLRAARQRGVAILAANAPRRLVTRFRKSDLPFPAFRASLADAERNLLPARSEQIQDAYRERFVALIGAERGPAFFRAQSLWDDAMAESVASARAERGDRRVLLVVGAFHVDRGGGTLTKLRSRRPGDAIATVVMDARADLPARLAAADRKRADLVLLLRSPRSPPRPAAHP